MNEKYVEDIVRFSIDRFSSFIRTSLLKFGDLLETTLNSYNRDAGSQLQLEIGRYSIFGFFCDFFFIVLFL